MYEKISALLMGQESSPASAFGANRWLRRWCRKQRNTIICIDHIIMYKAILYCIRLYYYIILYKTRSYCMIQRVFLDCSRLGCFSQVLT